jgi:hypothetical protein
MRKSQGAIAQADYGLVPESLEKFLTEQIMIMAIEMNLPNAS